MSLTVAVGLNPFHSFPVIYWNTVQYGSASGSLISSRYWPQQWTDLIWLESGSPCKAGCLCGTSQWVYPLMPSVKRLLQSSAWIHKPQEFYQLAYFSCPLDRGVCAYVCGLCLYACTCVHVCMSGPTSAPHTKPIVPAFTQAGRRLAVFRTG